MQRRLRRLVQMHATLVFPRRATHELAAQFPLGAAPALLLLFIFGTPSREYVSHSYDIFFILFFLEPMIALMSILLLQSREYQCPGSFF